MSFQTDVDWEINNYVDRSSCNSFGAKDVNNSVNVVTTAVR